MRRFRLVQIFRPVKEINRKHSGDYAEDLSTKKGRKRCAKMNGDMGHDFPNTCGLLKRAALERKKSAGGQNAPLYSLASLGFTYRGTPLYQTLRMNLGGEEGIS